MTQFPKSQPEQIRDRTKQFAIRILRLFPSLPKTEEAGIIGRQVLRSGTSVATNYRAVCRARSEPEFVAKMGTVVEEADETVFWLELLIETVVISESRTDGLLKEANELLSASQRTAKKN